MPPRPSSAPQPALPSSPPRLAGVPCDAGLPFESAPHALLPLVPRAGRPDARTAGEGLCFLAPLGRERMLRGATPPHASTVTAAESASRSSGWLIWGTCVGGRRSVWGRGEEEERGQGREGEMPLREMQAVGDESSSPAHLISKEGRGGLPVSLLQPRAVLLQVARHCRREEAADQEISSMG